MSCRLHKQWRNPVQRYSRYKQDIKQGGGGERKGLADVKEDNPRRKFADLFNSEVNIEYIYST